MRFPQQIDAEPKRTDGNVIISLNKRLAVQYAALCRLPHPAVSAVSAVSACFEKLYSADRIQTA
ncbi:hypothetical protein [Neisseria weaveri]|uniref:Uncharacterized protein n=1 Tax=Neisseria weaveri TaxID=28091 RepID=A0A3S4YT11_9NEIS|nr:hypothetical protein [Neisseria weaveri]EGV35997.1 hypothetical protein l11_18840 [Neisseria weaveri LMG 5135]SAY50597.1 Uncharacterised protein [Neisseria weaveri]VEJ52008.1 Uncharacterised protein [Neisseria weaveri]